MRLSGFLSPAQVETVHRNALRVLAEVGLQVEHEELRGRLAALGGETSPSSDRVRFSPAVVEPLLAEGAQPPASEPAPTVSAFSGVYESAYLDPETGEIRPFDEAALAAYVALARALPLVEGVHLLGLPFVPEGLPPRFLPLAEKLTAWKLGAAPSGSVVFTDLCEPLLDLFECHAAHTDRPLHEVFGAAGYLISPLKLARPECEQLLFFHRRGLRMGIGHLPSQGGTAPVTLAGALTLTLAEQMLLFLVQRSLWPDARFSVGGSVSPLDLRSATLCYGRPEQLRAILAFADLARRYGCACWGHAGLTDAKTPSVEAGAQKAVGALVSALATGRGSVEAGLLSTDEVCSPVQMVLDHDLAAGLRALLGEPDLDDAEPALEEILAAGPGGSHLGTRFTASHHRGSLLTPLTWSYQSLAAWRAAGSPGDVDRAREVARRLRPDQPPPSLISEAEERDLRAILRRAVERLGS